MGRMLKGKLHGSGKDLMHDNIIVKDYNRKNFCLYLGSGGKCGVLPVLCNYKNANDCDRGRPVR